MTENATDIIYSSLSCQALTAKAVPPHQAEQIAGRIRETQTETGPYACRRNCGAHIVSPPERPLVCIDPPPVASYTAKRSEILL